PDPLCEMNGTSPFWISHGTTTVQCPIKCPDGSPQQCTAVLQEEVVCVNDQIVPTGNNQPGEIIAPIGSCQPQPKDCGEHTNGSDWWDNTSTVDTTCEMCPDGSPHLCTMNVQTQFACHDGVISGTGQTQNGSIVKYNNECLPLP